MRRPTAFHYPVNSVNPTMVNLYYRHAKTSASDKQVTSIRRAAFEISVSIPKFAAQAMSYTRPSNYY